MPRLFFQKQKQFQTIIKFIYFQFIITGCGWSKQCLGDHACHCMKRAIVLTKVSATSKLQQNFFFYSTFCNVYSFDQIDLLYFEQLEFILIEQLQQQLLNQTLHMLNMDCLLIFRSFQVCFNSTNILLNYNRGLQVQAARVV